MWYVAYFATGAWLILASTALAVWMDRHEATMPNRRLSGTNILLWIIPIVALWPITVPMCMGQLLRSDK